MVEMISKGNSNVTPSPAEEVALMQSERERRRKLRLKQVREQEKQFASQLRQHAKDKKLAELRLLSSSLQSQWQRDQDEKCSALLSRYSDNLLSMGESHHAAESLYGQVNSVELRKPTTEEWQRAIERHKKALQKLMVEKENREQVKHDRLLARKKALEREKLRSELVAARPQPTDLMMNFNLDKADDTKSTDVEASFGSSHYHLRPRVERVPQTEQVDAKQSAIVEEEKLKALIEEMERAKDEQLEKARLRHRYALSQLQLEEDRKKLNDELYLLERMDKHRRQLEVSKIPVQIFQPPHKRREDAEQCQRDLELAFEEMYMKETGYTGDLAIALDRSSVGVTGVNNESYSSSVSEGVDMTTANKHKSRATVVPSSQGNVTPPAMQHGRDDVTLPAMQHSRDELEDQEQDVSTPDGQPSQPTVAQENRDPLKRLLHRIQGQRVRWQTQRESTPDGTEEELSEGPLTTEGSSHSEPITNLPERFGESIPTQAPFESAPRSGSEAPVSLLHPWEAAQLVRTPGSSAAPTFQTSVVPVREQLRLQLEKQQLHQQQLEQQLKQYKKHLEEIYDPGSISHQQRSDLVQQIPDGWEPSDVLAQPHTVNGQLHDVREQPQNISTFQPYRDGTEGMASPRHGLPMTDNSREGIITRSGSSESSYSGVELQEMSTCGYSASGEEDTAAPKNYQTNNCGIADRYPLVDEYYKHHLLPGRPSNVLSVEQVFDDSSSSLSSSAMTDKLPSQGTSGSTLDTTSTTYYQPPSAVYPKSTSPAPLSTSAENTAGFALRSNLSRTEKTETEWRPIAGISSTGTTSGASFLFSEPSGVERYRPYYQFPFVTNTHCQSNTLPSTRGVFTSSQGVTNTHCQSNTLPSTRGVFTSSQGVTNTHCQSNTLPSTRSVFTSSQGVTNTHCQSNTLPSTRGVFTSSQGVRVMSSSSLGTASGSIGVQGNNVTEVSSGNLSELRGNTTIAREDKPHHEFSSDSWPFSSKPFRYTSGSQMLSVRSSDTTSSVAPFAVFSNDIASCVEDVGFDPRTAEVTDALSKGSGQGHSTQSGSYFTTSASSGNYNPAKSSWSVGEINNNQINLPYKSSTGSPSILSDTSSPVSLCGVSLSSGSLLTESDSK